MILMNKRQIGNKFGETKVYGMEVNEQQSGVDITGPIVRK